MGALDNATMQVPIVPVEQVLDEGESRHGWCLLLAGTAVVLS